MKVDEKSRIPSVFVQIAMSLCLITPGWGAHVDWQQARKALGHQDKFRVLVDKVLSKSTDWVMTEKHMDEIHEAGFNVIVPRVGGKVIRKLIDGSFWILIFMHPDPGHRRPISRFSAWLWCVAKGGLGGGLCTPTRRWRTGEAL